MEITGNGLPYALLSGGEQVMVDAILSATIAKHGGTGVMMIDRFDTLSLPARSAFLIWLADLAEAGDIETAVVFATLKSEPTTLPKDVFRWSGCRVRPRKWRRRHDRDHSHRENQLRIECCRRQDPDALKSGKELTMEDASRIAEVTDNTAYNILLNLEKSGAAHIDRWNGLTTTKRATFRIGSGPLGVDKYGRSIRPPKPKKKKERKAGVMSIRSRRSNRPQKRRSERRMLVRSQRREAGRRQRPQAGSVGVGQLQAIKALAKSAKIEFITLTLS